MSNQQKEIDPIPLWLPVSGGAKPDGVSGSERRMNEIRRTVLRNVLRRLAEGAEFPRYAPENRRRRGAPSRG